MNIASFVLAVVAIVISAAGIVYAKRSAGSAQRAADAARRSAAAAESSLRIEERRRHEERRPKLSGEVSSPDGGHSYQLTITLDPDSCSLTALEVAIRPEQGVCFRRGFSGVRLPHRSDVIPLRAFAYDRTNKPTGVKPGETVFWWAELAKEYKDLIQVDATCHAAGKDEGQDQWTVVVEAPVAPRLEDTLR
jgi:hypothetical protein